jgi:hypothetical protein
MGSEAGGDIVMPKTTQFDAAGYLDTEARSISDWIAQLAAAS